MLHNEAIYPHPPKNERRAAADKLWTLTKQYKVEAVSIGNGTASRETEEFVRGLGLPKEIQIFVVSEDGASIYSASKVAREEFPDYDVTVRGAVSIGRRLMDPLAELVKIDPSSIGVGQYQKDVDQKELKHSLDQTGEHRQQAPAHIHFRSRSCHCPEHCHLPSRERCFRLSKGFAESAEIRSKGI